MGAFDLRFMWRPQTTEQAAQFSGELLKNSWAAGVVASIAYPYVGLAMAGVALLEKCGGSTEGTKDVFVRDLKDLQADAASDALVDVPIQPDVPAKDNQIDQYDAFDVFELRDLYEVRDVFDQLEIKDTFELTDSTHDIIDVLPDQKDAFEQKDFFEVTPDLSKDVADASDVSDINDSFVIPDVPIKDFTDDETSDEISQGEISDLDSFSDLHDVAPELLDDVGPADFTELADGLTDLAEDVGVDSGDELDLTDLSDETSTPPPACLIENASETFLVVKGFADPEMLQPLSLTEFLADLVPATPPTSPIYISIVIYNAGDEILPSDEDGLKLCYHGFGVSTCADNASFELACDDSLVYDYGPVSSIGLYGWTSSANGAAFEVRKSTSSYGLTIYADPETPDTSCYSLFNTFSCEYL